MGLHKCRPPLSGRMGTLWTLATIRNAALVEYGCMGHMLYGRVFLNQAGVSDGCKLYSTHIDETDISMGDTGRLHRTVAEVVKQDAPRVIFLLPSSVPTVIGTDLPAICRELQPEYPGVRLLPFGFGGFDVYGHRGVQEALLLLAQTLPVDAARTVAPTFNLIGSCADLFRFHADAEEIIRIMEGAFGMKPLCVMTSDTSVEDIEQMGGAHLNLVIRGEGEPAALHLRERFGTPYLSERPYGIQGTSAWIERVGAILKREPVEAFVRGEEQKAKRCLQPAAPFFGHAVRSHPDEAALSLGGHADVVHGILRYAVDELRLPRGACWCDSPDMADDCFPYWNEDAWTKAIREHKDGLLMASGEALRLAGHSMALQIANPDTKWRMNVYEPPFVGYRGAVHLAELWLNALMEQA